MSTSNSSAQATPLYDKFVEQAKKLNPRFLTMIIPARWYAGGMGLDYFRKSMVEDSKISRIVDFPNAGDCFPGIELRGGVCYFLWENAYNGDCLYSNVSVDKTTTSIRKLNEYEVFIRWNEALSVIEKVKNRESEFLPNIVSAVSPFGIATTCKFTDNKATENDIKVYTSKGIKFISNNQLKNGFDRINRYKVLISQLISGNMETPPFKVISKVDVLKPNEACTHTYIVAGNFDSENEANNLASYLTTKFVRFLLMQSISNMHISKDKFRFVPMQDFSKPWTDEELYAKYGLTDEEIEFIESMIRPMELGGDNNG